MGYTHPGQSERDQIQRQCKAGLSNQQIAEGLGRSTTTVDPELRRNEDAAGEYKAREAHKRSVLRRHAASARPHIDLVTRKPA